MNKKIILPFVAILVLAVAMVGTASADEVTTVDTVEVRGTIEQLGGVDANGVAMPNTLAADRVWDYSEFAGFWYDLDDNLQSESLKILMTDPGIGGPTLTYPNDRTLDEDTVIYTTSPVFQEYELHANEGDPDRGTAGPTTMETNELAGAIGLNVDSDKTNGDCGYFIEGWMAKEYVAIDENADKLCKLLVEFEDDDKKTLSTGEEWDLGSGFALVANQIDLEGDKVWLTLEKDGKELDSEVVDTAGTRQDRVYTYTADIGGEDNIPVFACYIDAVFRGTESNIVQVKYVFLIDDDVMEIKTGDTFGIMEATASKTQIVLRNKDDELELDEGSTEQIMGDIYFKTADDGTAIRFYPMVEYTEPGTYEVRGTIEQLGGVDANGVAMPNTLAADRVWDYSEFAGFWYDLDDNLQSESLKILMTDPGIGGPTLTYPNDRTLDEDTVIYTTSPVFQEYELHANEGDPDRGTAGPTTMETNELAGAIGLNVDSDKTNGDCGYFIEGWMAKEYVAIDENADKLCKLLVEFEDDDKKTLSTGEEWDLGSGFALVANQIDLEGDKVWLTLEKDGKELDSEVVDTAGTRQDRVYTYTADIGGEDNIPVFACYIDAVFRGTESNIVQVKYVFLIDDDVMEIKTGDTFGIMEATASKTQIVLRNKDDELELDEGSTEQIMGDMYFKTADDGTAIRFYPFVEYTIGEGGVVVDDEVDEDETPTNETADVNVTPTAVVTPTPEEAASPVVTATAEDTTAAEETATDKKTPGFEAVFAIAGLLAVAYLVLRQRE